MTSNLASGWTNLDLSETYIVDRAYARTQRLMRHDDLVQMLSEKSVLTLLAALFFEGTGGIAKGNALTITEPEQILAGVRSAVEGSPLTILNEAFVEHVANLVSSAIFPEQFFGYTD